MNRVAVPNQFPRQSAANARSADDDMMCHAQFT
jgi:hypothetical protein